jgi:hypothetical protein
MKTKLLKKLRKSSKKYIIRHKNNTPTSSYSLLNVTKSNPTGFIVSDFSKLNDEDFHYKIYFGRITAYIDFTDAFKKLKECRRVFILEKIEKMRNKSPVIKVLDI